MKYEFCRMRASGSLCHAAPEVSPVHTWQKMCKISASGAASAVLVVASTWGSFAHLLIIFSALKEIIFLQLLLIAFGCLCSTLRSRTLALCCRFSSLPQHQ